MSKKNGGQSSTVSFLDSIKTKLILVMILATAVPLIITSMTLSISCIRRIFESAKIERIIYTRNARMALSTAKTVTPTSAKTAIHMVAIPKAANKSTAILTPMANHTF